MSCGFKCCVFFLGAGSFVGLWVLFGCWFGFSVLGFSFFPLLLYLPSSLRMCSFTGNNSLNDREHLKKVPYALKLPLDIVRQPGMSNPDMYCMGYLCVSDGCDETSLAFSLSPSGE